jgi:zinc protease
MPFSHPRIRCRFAFFLLPLLAGAAGAAAPDEDARLALRTAAALYDGIRTQTLDNGLRVYLKPVPGAPVVTTLVAYKVGSADEDLDSTGLSHYLEHLMFKGTERLLPGDIDRLTFRNGGANNAYTAEDFTVFHFDFPPDRWETALAIESDRMRNLRIDDRHEFEQEKGAVIAELERDEDEPWDLEMKAIVPLLFGKKAPYGHPVIGEAAHVKAATARVIKAHYDRWYHPNNAALVVCGNFDPDRAMTEIKKRFGPIPRGKLPERKPLPPDKPKRPALLEFDAKFAVPRLLMGFNTVRSSDPDYPALAVLEQVLSGGKASRLYRELIEKAKVAGSVSTSNNAGRYPGWFAVQVEALPGKDRAKVEQLVLEQFKALRDKPISERELKRARHGILAGSIFARESVHDLGDSIARGVTTNDLDFLKNYLPRVLAVTAADVQRVARTYFDAEQRVTVWSVPPAKADEKKGDAREPSASRMPRTTRSRADRPAAARPFSLKDTRRVELPNGLVLLLLEDHRLPIFVAAASVNDVRLLEPADKLGVAHLTGALLTEGAGDLTGPQIAEKIEDVGGNLTLSSSGGVVRVLAPDRTLGLGLLLECLMHPTFPQEAFEREKARQLSEIEDDATRPEERGRQAYRSAVYGQHPYGRPLLGTIKSVTTLTSADCAAFHRRAFGPNNITLALVGDFDSKQILDEIKRRTADWKKADLGKIDAPEVEKPKESRQIVVTMPEAAQLHVFAGHLGIRRDNPDYYKLLVMDYIFGTGPGFTDRLSGRLRDREGLAYTVTANITPSADRQPGTFTFYIGTEARHYAQIKKEFREELARLRDEKPAAQEVADAKAYLLGNLLLQFTTDAGIAGQLLTIERHQLGFDYLEDYRKAVAAVTPEDVQTVARKYLDPKRMVFVAAGALDVSGKPITRLAPPKKK